MEAVHDRRRPDQRLLDWTPRCRAPRASRSATGSSRTTSPAPTATSASPRRSRSPATRSSTASATTSGSASAATPPTSTPRTRWSRRPRSSASAPAPASTCPVRRPAGSPTATGSAPTTSRRRTTTASSAASRRPRTPATSSTSSPASSASRATLYRAGDAVNFSIGQGDTIVTPLQLARGYAALSNGGTLWAPTVAKAIVSPEGKVLRRIAPRKVGKVDVPKKYLDYIDGALRERRQGRHDGLEARRLPDRRRHHPRQDRLRRGLRQAVDRLGRVLLQGLRRGDDDQPGRHRLGLDR